MQTTQTGNVQKGNFHVDDAENAYFFCGPCYEGHARYLWLGFRFCQDSKHKESLGL